MTAVKAGALQLVTYIVMLIALLLAAFILVVHTYKKFDIDTQLQIVQIKNSQRAINQFLQVQDISNDSIRVNNDFSELGNITFKRGNWGVFETFYAVSHYNNKLYASMALVGAKNTRYCKSALVLKDNNMPIVIVGGTTITGNVCLPKRGIKTGHIAGVSYYNEQLIYGEQQPAPKVFPRISKQITESLNTLQERIVDEPVTPLNGLENNTYSFLSPLNHYLSSDEVVLNNVNIKGHIIIQSDTKIIVGAKAQLNDLILVAPVIQIMDQVTGNFQAIATTSIEVGSNVTLFYPSALVLNKDTSEQQVEDLGTLTVGEGTNVKGVILVIGEQLQKNYEPQLTIASSANITGMVYCNQNMELRGTVTGMVITDQFIIKEAGSVYINHLFNAIINRPALDDAFLGVEIDDEHEKGIVKWLY
jgi:cytoskeletal protein CcmA (bactofilin family)